MWFKIRPYSSLLNGDRDPYLRRELSSSAGASLIGYDNGTVSEAINSTFDVFNIKRNGADDTGVNTCDNILLSGAHTEKPIYLSKGIYRCGLDRITLPIKLVGDGDKSILYLDKPLMIENNFKALNVKFVLSATYIAYCVTNNIYPTMFITPQSGNGINEVIFDSCVFDFDSEDTNRYITGWLWLIKYLQIVNCYNLKGGIRLHYVDYYNVSDNHFDMKLKNLEWECVHVVFGNKGGVIQRNLMENNLADFIDVYPSAGNVLIDRNHLRRGQNIYITAKNILSDVGNPNGGSNLTGALRNVSITNNVFSENGAEDGVPYIDIGMYDRRTPSSRVPNDYQYYSENITIKGNTFDESDIADISKNTNFIFVGGIKNLIIENNNFKYSNNSLINSICIRYDNKDYDGLFTDKKSINHRINNNNVIGKQSYIFLYIKNPVDGLHIKNNSLQCEKSLTAISAVSDITNVVVEHNEIKQTLLDPLGSIRTFSLSGGVKNILFRNQKLDTIVTSSVMDNLFFDGCEANAFISINANVGLLIFKETSFTTGEVLIATGITISTLVSHNLLALPGKNHVFLNLGTVAKYYETGGVYLKGGSSIWVGTGTRPAKTDDSTKFS